MYRRSYANNGYIVFVHMHEMTGELFVEKIKQNNNKKNAIHMEFIFWKNCGAHLQNVHCLYAGKFLVPLHIKP